MFSMKRIATALKTLGHPDRLRVLALLSQGELTVSELVQILDLSQPRITQYIKSLEDAGIIERMREGSWVFSRLRQDNAGISAVVATALATLPHNDPDLSADRERLADVRAERSKQAEAFFASVANDREQLGHEYLPQEDIEAAMLKLLSSETLEIMVDLGTGTGRMLEVFASHIDQGTGIDASPDMLRVARHTLAQSEFSHISVQQADLTDTKLPSDKANLVTLHQVLHFLDDPILAIREAARLLAPQGQLLVTDFEAHDLDYFRDSFAHRRLGFEDSDIQRLFVESGLTLQAVVAVPSGKSDVPTVKIWHARKSAAAQYATG